MAKLIQICASQNDLFGLDADGMVHQYNFSTNAWMKLGRGRSDQASSALVPDKMTGPKPYRTAPRAEAEPPRGTRP